MSEKLFSSEFFSCLISSETGSRFSLSDYFENAYSRSYDFCASLPYVLSSREVSVTSPFSYEISRLDAFCLIHTTKGAGTLFCDNPVQADASYELTKGTLAFIDCRQRHKLLCRHNIWEYAICFVSTPLSAYYYRKLAALGGCIFRPAAGSEIRTVWEQLAKTGPDDEAHGLIRCHALVSLYTQLYLARFAELNGSYHIPSYILDMKKCFDTHYSEQYALDVLAAKYRVNKFRLCREFAKYYEDTPLQYLNKVRLDHAKDLLLHSDEKIVDISRIVGFENTNHFIRLFKEKNGVTPLTYRKETPLL
ncbi:MAG: helix-turn-helix transcriptional regulator [Roseburia sp.]|nr:helix-turn-helix transcriptional regulator [Roseburia sp.]